MKSFNLLLLTVLSLICCKYNAQITVTSSNTPDAGEIFIYDISTDILSEDFSLTGSAYSWNYSTATSSAVDSVKVVSVGSTPLAYQYYFNNQWTEPDYYSDYAQRGRDLNAQGQVTIEDRYDFYGVNTNSLEIKGFGAKVNGVPASIKYDTIDQIYPFPMTFGMATHNSSGYYLASIPNMGTYGQWIRREVTVDGYGSLTTPNTTYTNTIRVKTILLQTDTIFVDQFGFGQTFDRPDEIIYEWFTDTDNVPVMRVVIRNSQATEAKYLLEVTTGVEELDGVDFSIATTSSEGIYHLINYNSAEKVVVFNNTGSQIGTFSPNNIDLHDQASGIYFVIVSNNGSNHCFKVVK